MAYSVGLNLGWPPSLAISPPRALPAGAETRPDPLAPGWQATPFRLERGSCIDSGRPGWTRPLLFPVRAAPADRNLALLEPGLAVGAGPRGPGLALVGLAVDLA